MKSVSVAKREMWHITSNKRYMAGFLLQLLLLLTIVPSLSSVLEEGSLSLPTPTLRGYVVLGMVDQSLESTITREELLRNPKIEIRYFQEQEAAMEEMERGALSAVMVLPRDFDENGMEELTVKMWTSAGSFKRGSALGAVDDSLAFATERIVDRRRQALGIPDQNPIQLDRHFLKPVVIEKGGSRFSSFFLGYLIPMVLFFPIFMSGGIVVDSVVGEKEGRTLESLLSAPLSRESIVLGKFMGIYGFINLQCLLWLVILVLRDIPIAGFWGVFVLLSAVNAAVIALALLLAVYSTGTKGANISLMFMYVVAFTLLVTTLSMEFFNPRGGFALIPAVAISRLAVGEPLGPLAFILLVSGLGFIAGALLWGAGRLLERDDVALGIKPDLFTIFADGSGDLLSTFGKHPLTASSFLAVSASVVSLPLALLAEVTLGLVVLYFFGLGGTSVPILVLLFAAAEELLKPLPVFALKRQRPELLNGHWAFVLGGIAGLGFWLLETSIVALFTVIYVPSLVLRIITLRTGTTLLVHVLATGIMGQGIARARKTGGLLIPFFIAVALHAAFNILVVGM